MGFETTKKPDVMRQPISIHTSAGQLRLVRDIHNQGELHIESPDPISIDADDWNDGDWFTIVNTSDFNMPSFMTFSNWGAVFLRDGSGDDISNTAMHLGAIDACFMCRVTDWGGIGGAFLNVYPLNLKVVDKSVTVGDVKDSYQTQDHEDWVMLNGRSIDSLLTIHQQAWNSLGVGGTNLPDARGRSAVGAENTTFPLGAVGGSAAIDASNLPPVTVSGTSGSAGSHSHTTNPSNVSATTSSDSHNHGVNPGEIETTTASNSGYNIPAFGSTTNFGLYMIREGTVGTARWIVGRSTQETLTNLSTTHRHNVDVLNTGTTSDAHSHTVNVDVPSTTSSTIGNHTHTTNVNLNAGVQTDYVAPYLALNKFIYLGA